MELLDKVSHIRQNTDLIPPLTYQQMNIRFYTCLLLLPLWVSCLNDPAEMEMVFVEGGSFMMGDLSAEADPDEQPLREVRVEDFYISKYEVTQRQWNLLMRRKNPSSFVEEDHPVEGVHWFGVQLFIQRLNERTGHNYRLPTEAEWEYAARGGALAAHHRFSGEQPLNEVGWWRGNADQTSHPVGSLRPNALGIYDMTGNVHEWCSDYYLGEGEVADSITSERAFRGGSWLSDERHCRISNRNHTSPETTNYTLGFRLVESGQ